MPILNKEQAIALCCVATAKHAEATETGNYKSGNAASAQIIEALMWLNANQEIQLIYPLLNVSDVGTRLWAASYLLTTGDTAAVAVLINLASLNNIHGLSAKTTLSEWRAGRLKLLV